MVDTTPRRRLIEAMKKHHDLVANGVVSVWVGLNFSGESDFLSYVDDGPFSVHFGFRLNPSAGRELTYEKAPVSIEALVEGFSYWRTFISGIVSDCDKATISEANCALIIYNLQYDPDLQTRPDAPLRFIGVYEY